MFGTLSPGEMIAVAITCVAIIGLAVFAIRWLKGR